jgi:ribosomal protein L14
LKFFANRVLVFNKQYKFLGTRVYGGIAKEIKIQSMKEKKDRKSFQKVVSYSSLIV